MQRHPLAALLLVVSYVVIANFAVDVIRGAFPNSPAAGGVKQAVTGA